jgi:hypothetical protein
MRGCNCCCFNSDRFSVDVTFGGVDTGYCNFTDVPTLISELKICPNLKVCENCIYEGKTLEGYFTCNMMPDIDPEIYRNKTCFESKHFKKKEEEIEWIAEKK